MDIKFFSAQAEWHDWLEENHDKATEMQVGFYKKGATEKGITYSEALDEALCFGWIDGVRKGIDERSYTIRFTPRKSGSIWSAVNIKRAGELTEQGLMQPAGLKAFEGRDLKKAQLYSFEQESVKLDSSYEEQFRAHEQAWSFFEAQPPSYRKMATWWVMSAKREET